jgi:signal transduction histidine kinase
MTLPEFVRQFTPELPTLVGLRNAAAAAAISEATRSRDLSWNRVATSSAVLVLVLAAIGGLTVYFTRRVVVPLIEMTAKVGQLADGNRTVDFVVADRKDEVGGLARAMGMFRDALIANEELQTQLLQSQKMQAIGTMAGGVAHELNNLLQPILLLAGFLGDRFPAEDIEAREDVSVILDHAERARDIVANIVTFSRKTVKSVGTLDIAAEMRGAGALIRSLLPSSVDLSVKVSDGSCLVAVDRTELMQVLTNLVVNASQAMHHRGSVGVVLEHSEISESRSAALQIAPGGYASLSVTDSGPGIEATILDRIFEPFFTTKPAGQGTGLGLSVAYGIVRAWKGALKVDSKVGHGTTFSILIPLNAA